MSDTAVVQQIQRKSLMTKFADRYSVEPGKMMDTLKQTAFKQSDDKPITNEQMMALIVVADQYRLNPFTKEIYAFPDKGGIVPIVGLDGWSRLMNENEHFDGMEFEYSDKQAKIDDHHQKCPESVTCIIYRKDRSHPIKVTEYLDEVYRAPFIKNKGQQSEYVVKGPWQSHTKRMLRHKAMIQCARIAFGYTGIYDQDEAERIVGGGSDYIDVEATEIIEPEKKGGDALKEKLRGETEAEPTEEGVDDSYDPDDPDAVPY